MKLKILLLLFLIFLGYFIFNFFITPSTSEVLQSSTTSSPSFGDFLPVNINQYPTVSYLDGLTSPFQSRFSNYRNLSPTSEFTHYLCSGTSGNCLGYTQKPKFIRLNFDGSEKLMLFNFYGLYSVDENTNSFKWESAHIDRFRTTDSNLFPNCAFKYDPDSIIPVKSGNNFYLFSKFKGTNNSQCLQFYDHRTASPSSSIPNAKLYLGYEVLSNGTLNRNYNRTGTSYQNLAGQGPFGPGPQNSSLYSTSPRADILGCKQFDSLGRCVSAGGVSSETYSYTPQSTTTQNFNCRTETYIDTCAQLTCESFTPTNVCVDWGEVTVDQFRYFCGPPVCDSAGICQTSDCTWQNFPVVQTVCQRYEVRNDRTIYTTFGSCGVNNHIGTTWVRCEKTREVCDTRTVTVPSSFSARLRLPTFSNFSNLNFNPLSWNNVKGVGIPTDYTKYSDELNNTNIDNALNYTQELNKTVFTSTKYLFKLNLNNNVLTIRRYNLNTNSYDVGGTTYIVGSSIKTINLNLKNNSNNLFSLHYSGDDIFVMASGSNNPDFYRIRNFNSEGSFTSIDLSQEVSQKLPSPTGGALKSFGIINVNGTSKMYLLTATRAFWSNIQRDIVIEEFDTGYNNFEFNGNVFSKENLNSGFMFTAPSDRLKGSYITSADFSSNLKFLNNSKLAFGYPSSFNSSLVNFSNFNGSNFQKFNYLYDNVSFNESIPLQDSQYITLNPNSSSDFEIINISKGKGVKIDLTNQNLIKNFDKYILVNLDKANKSRINFYIDCNNSSYSLICSGSKFNFKGSLLGQFYVSGNITSDMQSKRFIRIHENAESLIKLTTELRRKKYQTVSNTVVFVKYE